jgi:hypothetical protein
MDLAGEGFDDRVLDGVLNAAESKTYSTGAEAPRSSGEYALARTDAESRSSARATASHAFRSLSIGIPGIHRPWGGGSLLSSLTPRATIRSEPPASGRCSFRASSGGASSRSQLNPASSWSPIRILTTSGFVRAGKYDLPERSRFLAKPYQPAHVVATLRELAGSG